MPPNAKPLLTRLLSSVAETERFAEHLAKHLKLPAVLSFSGEIGMGKTTLIRALLRALGIQGAIKSPTFSLVESYEWQDFFIHHFDLYRLQDEEELAYLGFRDYFSDQSLCLIEWPEHAGKALPKVDGHFSLGLQEQGRWLEASAFTTNGNSLLHALVRQ